MSAEDMKLYLRQAGPEDLTFLFDLRNEEEVRKASFNTSPVSLEEHSKWFFTLLDDPARMLFILTDGSSDYGQVRLDDKDGCYVISYAIVPDMRGHGFGRRILELAQDKLSDIRDGFVLKAEVKADNTASRRTFLSLGYNEERKDDIFIYTKEVNGSTYLQEDKNDTYSQ